MPPSASVAADASPIQATDSASTSASASPPVDLFELKIEAGKKTKVTVNADANRVFSGTMKPGENRTFSAKDRFEVSAKDAGALLLEMNGKTLAPIGPPGRAAKVTLTRDALKGAPGGEN
jgi:uncharacterized protein DUF4115